MSQPPFPPPDEPRFPQYAQPDRPQEPQPQRYTGLPYVEQPYGALPQQGPYSPGYGYGAPPAQQTSGLAIAALVVSLFGLVPIAVGLGIAALVGIRRTRESGSGMAIAALAISAAQTMVLVLVVAVGLAGGFDDPTAAPSDPAGTPAVTDAAADLSVYQTSLDPDFLYPSREMWEEDGDRSVLCLTYGPDSERLTGSVKGTKR